MRQDRISHGGMMAGYTDELILTNLNLVLIEKGVFGKVKSTQTFPVNQIKVFNGQAQAILGKQSSGAPKLDVYFLNGQENFGFESKRDVIKWIKNINALVSGNEIDIDSTPSTAIPGAEMVAETLKGTVDAFKGTFGIKSRKDKNTSENVVAKCNSCGATISGKTGQVVNCPYCGTVEQL
jgi:hypothetical protein